MEFSGIHSPPEQVRVGYGLARPRRDFEERWVQAGPGQPAGAGEGWGISTENICLGVWPLHQGRGWTGTGKANQVVSRDLLWGDGPAQSNRV